MGQDHICITPYVDAARNKQLELHRALLDLREAVEKNVFEAKEQEGFKARFVSSADESGTDVRLRIDLPYGAEGVITLGCEDIIAFRDYLVATAEKLTPKSW
jgi:hypothetical protein